MVHDLFSLKVKLNARHLTTEMGTHTFTVRADRIVDGRVQQLCKVFPPSKNCCGSPTRR